MARARSVAFDFILNFDAGRLAIDGTRPLKDYHRDFLRMLHIECRTGRIILGRSGLILPARRFQQVIGAGQLGLLEEPLGPGNVVRGVRFGLTGEDGTELATLVPYRSGARASSRRSSSMWCPPRPSRQSRMSS